MQSRLILKNIFLLICLGLFSGCTSIHIIQLPELGQSIQYELQEKIGENIQKSLLIIEPTPNKNVWRWIVVDALGSPITRQILNNGQWENDGFVPPGKKYRPLFTAILAFMIEDKSLPQYLAQIKMVEHNGQKTYYVDNQKKWQSQLIQTDILQFKFTDHSVWNIRKINE